MFSTFEISDSENFFQICVDFFVRIWYTVMIKWRKDIHLRKMPKYIERIETANAPVIPLRGLCAFPSLPINFELEREMSVKAAEEAMASDMLVYLVMQKDASCEAPLVGDLHPVGCLAQIKQAVKTEEGYLRVSCEGLCRASLSSAVHLGPVMRAQLITKTVKLENYAADIRTEALRDECVKALEGILKYIPSVSDDIITTVRSIRNPGLLADFIAANILVRPEDRQAVLAVYEPLVRLEKVIVLIESEAKLLRCEMMIHKKVREQIDEGQREYYLREQLKVIQNELGMDSDEEIDEYTAKVGEAALPDEVREKLNKEVSRLAKTSFGSPEAAVIRNYIDTCLEIPWLTKSADRIDVKHARKILDADHDGLEKVKDRICEYLSVKQLNPELKNQILCLYGPPGVGKTSLGASIARAMNRKYVRVSLGGIRDESDIRGHRKTYIGSMPGRIIDALIRAKTSNPVILLDEVDKMCSSAQGDPASALLEVLDAEQNKEFRDHFIELPVDLSDCLFIATANSLEPVARPLLDRMEVIELHTYTKSEKTAIARHHLIPKQLKRHGLNGRKLKITDDGLSVLIDGFTKESGVRTLERHIAALCRKCAAVIVSGEAKTVTVSASNIEKYLGPRRFIDEESEKKDLVGVVSGLAYTEVGGDLLKIESSVMDGTGKLELTGTLGDVMKESAHIAVSYIRAHSKELGINSDFYKTKDIHIHVPEGAVPKDGPSAGVTMLTSLVSTLTGRAVHCDLAMTGELTLTGRVLAIGGLREKTAAAYAAGIGRVIIPKENERDITELDPEVRAGLSFIPCSRAEEVLALALCSETAPAASQIAAEADTPAICVIPEGVSAPSAGAYCK